MSDKSDKEIADKKAAVLEALGDAESIRGVEQEGKFSEEMKRNARLLIDRAILKASIMQIFDEMCRYIDKASKEDIDYLMGAMNADKNLTSPDSDPLRDERVDGADPS